MVHTQQLVTIVAADFTEFIIDGPDAPRPVRGSHDGRIIERFKIAIELCLGIGHAVFSGLCTGAGWPTEMLHLTTPPRRLSSENDC